MFYQNLYKNDTFQFHFRDMLIFAELNFQRIYALLTGCLLVIIFHQNLRTEVTRESSLLLFSRALAPFSLAYVTPFTGLRERE